MHDLILHSYRRCPFAIRVRMVLEEKSLPYTTIEEDLSEPSTELLRLHPQGRVPLLIHKGVVIHESSIITEYLDEAFGPPTLTPPTPRGRAELRMWTFWCNELLKPDLDDYKYEWDSLSASEQKALSERIRGHLDRLESALTQHPYLMGAELSLTDIHLFPFYRQLQKARPDFQAQFQTARLDQWLDRIIQRPSFERVMRKNSPKPQAG